MGTTAEKLVYLGQTKADIRNAIIAKGVTVPTDTTFRNYATKVAEIETNQKLVDYATRVNNNGGNLENTPLLSPFIKALTTEKLALLPSGKKVGKLYAQLPVSGIGDATVTRASIATYKDASGLIQTAQANVARIEDGTLLLEPQATNLITYPRSFSNTYWTKTECTVVSGVSVPSIDYPISGFKMIESVTNGIHRMTSPILSLSTNTYSYSVFAKKAERNWLLLEIFGGGAVYFDLNNGTIGNNSAIKANITPLYDGWYICSITVSITSNQFVRINLANANNSPSYQGNGTSGIYVAFVQLEQSTAPTSLILPVTEGVTTTRVAGSITIPIPSGTTSITETINGIAQTPITTFGATHTVSNGKINKVIML